MTVLPMVHPEASQMSTVLYEQTGKIVTITINAVAPAAELMATARKWAETICERGPLAVRAAKEAILRGLSMSLPDGLRLEAFRSGTLRGTEDAVEGPTAFAKKRKPNFQAR
jgi:enoyl-CoA hydratase/carnithine racemase